MRVSPCLCSSVYLSFCASLPAPVPLQAHGLVPLLASLLSSSNGMLAAWRQARTSEGLRVKGDTVSAPPLLEHALVLQRLQGLLVPLLCCSSGEFALSRTGGPRCSVGAEAEWRNGNGLRAGCRLRCGVLGIVCRTNAQRLGLEGPPLEPGLSARPYRAQVASMIILVLKWFSCQVSRLTRVTHHITSVHASLRQGNVLQQTV